jgi:serine/threonine protein kinase
MFKAPSTIGRYKVLGELGRGSMGVVYLAEDPALKREVAIKLVHGASVAQSEVLSRFQREAEISARLNHPNVITVFDVGEEKEFGPFMAMEYADGDVLSELLARGALEPFRAALILIQGFHALQAAHSLGIIHRDFKPENLILTRRGRLKLMDFGIARREDPLMTGSGVLCTPSFAAPEILEQKPPCPATDNWAFCVTACLMVTGALPFHTASISSLLYAIVHDPPTFPEGLSPALQYVFTKALEKDPGARYPDLRAFMLDLLDALPLDPESRSRCLTLLDTAETTGEETTRTLSRLSVLRIPHWVPPSKIWWAAGILAAAAFTGIWLARRPEPRRITLTAYPPYVEAFLDNQPLGTTPLMNIQIPPQGKTIRFEKKGYQSVERTIGPEDHMLTLALPLLPTVLNIESSPAGADVFVNNVLKGITPLQGIEVAKDQSCNLQIRKAGYETWSKTLPPGEALQEVIQLRKSELPKPPKKSFWKRLFESK